LTVTNLGANTIPALKNADELLHDVLKAVDTSGDGQIQYDGTATISRRFADQMVELNSTERTPLQSSESLSTMLKGNYGSYSRALIAITMVSWIKTS